MTKRFLNYLCHIVLLLIIFSTLFLIITIKINADDSKVPPYFEPLDYKGISAEELQNQLGEADEVREWEYEVSRSEDGVIHYCRMVSYLYGNREFIYAIEDGEPDSLVRIHLSEKIPYTPKTLLALFNVSDNYTNSQTALNTQSAYRVFNVGQGEEGIYDFWVSDRDTNYLYDVNITFYNGLFIDDEI